MRIALYSHSIAPSIDGVCRRFTSILHELSRHGHELLLFTLEECPQDIPAKTMIVSLPFMIMPQYPGKKVAQPSIISFAKIWKSIQKFQPDIIHITGDGFSQLFSLVSMLLRVPIVGSFHTDLIDLLVVNNATSFQKWVVLTKERVDSIILDSCATTSVSFAEKLSKQGLYCEHVIITSVDIETFDSSRISKELRREMTFGNENGFLCVFVGRIALEKRLDFMVDVIRKIEGAYFAIIGDGPNAEQYMKLHGQHNRVYCKPQFLSHIQLAEIYASSDVHVSASEFETLGNTVLEAFASSIPVVVPKTQGFQDTVTHGENGFLFSPGDSEGAKSYLDALKSDVQLRNSMGVRGRQAVVDRTIEHVTADLIKWYNRGISNRRQKGYPRMLFDIFLSLLFSSFGVFAFACYQILMDILISCGYSPWKET